MENLIHSIIKPSVYVFVGFKFKSPSTPVQTKTLAVFSLLIFDMHFARFKEEEKLAGHQQNKRGVAEKYKNT